MQVGGQLSATRLQILQNTGGYAVAGYVSSARITMQNSIVNGNRGTVGIDGLYLSAAVAEIINSTIVDHEHGLVVDVGELDSSDLTLQNSIIGGGDFGLLLYGSNVIDVSYTWFFGHSGWDWYPAESNQIGTRGNVSQDPEFVEFTADAVGDNDDLQLAVLSPAVDAGDPAVLDSDGTTSDVGAYGGVEAAW